MGLSNYWWCAILFRLALPCVIISAAFARPTVTCYLYLAMGLYLPFFSVPTTKNMARSTGGYLKLLVMVSVLTNSFVASFYLAVFFPKDDSYYLQPCSSIETALRTIGVIDFRNLPKTDAVYWYYPEPLMLLSSALFYSTFVKFTKETDMSRVTAEVEGTSATAEWNRKRVVGIFLQFGKYTVAFLFCLAAVIKPSIIGTIYYLAFLAILTYWACNQSLDKIYARLLILMFPLIAAHLTLIHLYQFQYIQDISVIAPDTIFGRLTAMFRLRTYKDCSDPRLLNLHEQTNVTYAFPYLLYALFHLSVLVAKGILHVEDGIVNLLVGLCSSSEYHAQQTHARWSAAFTAIREQQFEEDDEDVEDEESWDDTCRRYLTHFNEFIISGSYLIANFIMMIWAILYIRWNTIALLLWANLIWLIPGRKRIMLAASPFVVFYVWLLLSVGYVYSINISIPSVVGDLDLAEDAQKAREEVWIHLLIRSLFAVIIFIPLRQYFQERALRRQERRLSEVIGLARVSELDAGAPISQTWQTLEAIVCKWTALLWIWGVVIIMIWMDFMSTNYPASIIFVALAFVIVTAFQLTPFEYWKKFVAVYWWIVITYAMLNLIVVYMYQLAETRKFLHTYVYPKEGFERFGFEEVTNAKTRLVILAYPVLLQIAIVIQQHYLQDDFDKYTTPLPPEELAKEEQNLEEIDSLWKKIIIWLRTIKNFLFLCMELHLTKIIIFTGWLVCCFDFCALFLPFVILLTFSCVFGQIVTDLTIYLMSIFVQVLIVLRLIYMNQYMDHDSWNYVGYYTRNKTSYNVTLNSASWLGFHKSRYGREIADFRLVSWCFLFVFFVTLNRVVRIRQSNYRKSRNLPSARQRVFFPEINFRNCHENTKTLIMFFANYGFYKFGVEITAIVSTLVIMVRMDGMAIALAISLIVSYSLNRVWIERIMVPFMIMMSIWLPFEYFSTLGYWPTYWNFSGTRYWNENDFRVRVQQFCHIMNMAHPPKRGKMVYDFVLLMCLCRQWRVFRVARNDENFPAGSNKNVAQLADSADVDNPVPDYVTYTRNLLDIYKRIFFFGWFYLSLVMTLLAGTMKPSVFSFGYILASFAIMWEGTDLFLRPPKVILFRWNLLILFNLIIILIRTFSQIVGCIYVYEWSRVNCRYYSMFNVGCVDRFGMTDDVPAMSESVPCKDHFDVLGQKWDCICFFFLIIQQRIFKSFHFVYIINTTKAQSILARLVPEIINEQQQKKRQTFNKQETFIRDNMKKKMELIQANRSKIKAIRSGDYASFEDVERTLDIPLIPPKQEVVDTEIALYDPMSLYEYVNLTLATDISVALEKRAIRRRQKQLLMEGTKEDDMKKIIAKEFQNQSTRTSQSLETPVGKFMKMLQYLLGLLESTIVSVTSRINQMTYDFRLILAEMRIGKMILNEKTNYKQGIRTGKIWQASETYAEILKSARESKAGDSKLHLSIYEKLMKAVFYLLVSQSEWVCYLLIVLHQASKPHFISLPLPLMVFFWGALTIPKPTKTFWVIIITYTLMMVIIKNFFVMEITDINKYVFPENPFYPTTVIGIDRGINSLNKLLLLGALLFHRVVLQTLGSWESFDYRPASLIKDGTYNLKEGKFVPLQNNEAANPQTLLVGSIPVTMGEYFPSSMKHGAQKYAEGFRLFILQLLTPSSMQVPVDVYTSQFLCDFTILLLVLFFFSSFFESPTSTQTGLLEIIQSNRVPISYISSVIVYTFLIVIDRCIYMRKNRFAKLIYYVFEVITLHMWAFVLFPMITGQPFADNLVVQTCYVLKCIYFLFSAYQIRRGYPLLISDHCLTHGTTPYHGTAFTIYKLIPYGAEIRSLLDWTCSDSPLDVTEWFKMENIMSAIYKKKCHREAEIDPDAKPSRVKRSLMGGCLFLVLFLTIIFPFLLFSLAGSVGKTTRPSRIDLEIYMGTSEAIFRSHASTRSQIVLTKQDYKNLSRTFNNIAASEDLFGAFENEDVVVYTWSSHSFASWIISPGSLTELIDELKEDNALAIRVVLRYIHIGHGMAKVEKTFVTLSQIPPLPNESRQILLEMLQGVATEKVIWLPLAFPKFIMISKESRIKVLDVMEEPKEEEIFEFDHRRSRPKQQPRASTFDVAESSKTHRNLLLALREQGGDLWWQVHEECDLDDDNYMYYLKDLPYNNCHYLVMYTFNEKVFAGPMQFITGGGILGLYFIYFMVVLNLLRQCQVAVNDIWVEDMPNVDKLFRKCKDVYIARDLKNWELEKELYADLIFIMRSRETCIRLTKLK